MKRAPELQPLSREHRDALIVSRRLRRGAEGKESLAEAVAAFRAAWGGPLAEHFREEEEILLPPLAGLAGRDDPHITRVLSEHAEVARLAAELEGAAGEQIRTVAARLGRLLDDHIRFEERVLFPRIEASFSPELLASVGRELERRAAKETQRRGGG